MTTDTLLLSDLAVPPGEYLEEVLEEQNLTQAELARRTGRPIQAINEIIKGIKVITPETALQLEQVLGVPAHIWTKLEWEYRLILAKQQLQEGIENEVKLLDVFPYQALCELELVEPSEHPKEQVVALRKFFAVASLNNVKTVKAYAPAFRQLDNNTLSHESLVTWLHAAKQLAEQTLAHSPDFAPYKKPTLNKIIPILRSHSGETSFDRAFTQAQTLLASAGVILLKLPTFTGANVKGATFWVNTRNAVVVLAQTYDYADRFWFGLLHEIGHIVLHNKRITFIETPIHEPAYKSQEEEADQFAQQALIPASDYETFIARGDYSLHAMTAFAATIHIHVSIVIGRLLHEGVIDNTFTSHRIQF